MPNSNETRTQRVTTGNPDTVNDSQSGLLFGGQPGEILPFNNRLYQYVTVDSNSSALAANAANDVMFWKDRTTYLVTRDSRFSNGARNNVAGILRNAATSGNNVFVLQRGDAISVKSDGNGAAGDIAIANSGTSADVTNISAGSAITYVPVGKIVGAAVASVISVDLNIPSAP